jgi:hypothetical protein
MFLAIAATLALATQTLILNPQLAQAQQSMHIQGSSGTGEVICPSGSSPPQTEHLSFSADKSKKTLFGDWNIFSNATFQVVKAGDITGGQISGKKFTLTGTEDIDDLCSSQIPATITITGQCGSGVTLQFKSSNGQEGQFFGIVDCVKQR